MKNIFFIAVMITAWIISSSCVYACSCVSKVSADGSFSEVPFDSALEKSDAVFRGKVIDFRLVKADHDYREAVFEVSEAWKGPQEKKILILTGLGGGDCGFDFIVGREYLVFAGKYDNGYGANICGGTRQWLNGQEIYQSIGEGTKIRQFKQ